MESGMWAGDYNLNLAQIMVEPLGLLLAANPSPRCSAPFWPLHALIPRPPGGSDPTPLVLFLNNVRDVTGINAKLGIHLRISV